MPIQYGGPGVTPAGFSAQPYSITLQGGNAFNIPSGRWLVNLGALSILQEYNPITGSWSSITTGANGAATLSQGATGLTGTTVFSDGFNYRVLNPTGLPFKATPGGTLTGYTSGAPTLTASAGGAVLKAIVGGAVSSFTVTNGGTNYTYPPIVLIATPPSLGIQATAYSTLSSGAVSSITLGATPLGATTGGGAGYTVAPTITLINDPREGLNGVAQGSGASAVCTLGTATTLTGVVIIDPGSAQATAPTVTVSSGSATVTLANGSTWVTASNDVITLLAT
jgi:hypothetical protein